MKFEKNYKKFKLSLLKEFILFYTDIISLILYQYTIYPKDIYKYKQSSFGYQILATSKMVLEEYITSCLNKNLINDKNDIKFRLVLYKDSSSTLEYFFEIKFLKNFNNLNEVSYIDYSDLYEHFKNLYHYLLNSLNQDEKFTKFKFNFNNEDNSSQGDHHLIPLYSFKNLRLNLKFQLIFIKIDKII